MEIKQQVIAMGGGGFSMEPENLLLDRYIIQQARKPRPSVCFLPHATDDATRYSFRFFKTFAQLDVCPTHLSLFHPHTADMESFLMEQDVIYVGGGNTKSMMAIWREWQMDIFLRQAYEHGTSFVRSVRDLMPKFIELRQSINRRSINRSRLVIWGSDASSHWRWRSLP